MFKRWRKAGEERMAAAGAYLPRARRHRPAKNGRLLLAESDGPTRARLEQELAGYGFKLRAVDNGVDALCLANEGYYDLAVVDSLVLESFMETGANLILELRAKNPWLRFVLMLDAHAPSSRFFDQAMLGLMNPIVIDETVSKPVDPSVLVKAILFAL